MASHHSYPNIPGLYMDVKQSILVRIFPTSQYLWFHRFQFVYMPLIYSVYTLHWLLIRDTMGWWHNRKLLDIGFWRFLLPKSAYFCMMVLLPWVYLEVAFMKVTVAFFVMQVTASYTVAIALASAHVGQGISFPSPSEEGKDRS